MTRQEDLSQTMVRDGAGERLVRPGDEVTLIPPELTGFAPDSDEMYLARQEYERHLERPGRGPHIIDEISRWPCGKVMLYFATGGGYYAEDFMVAQQTT